MVLNFVMLNKISLGCRARLVIGTRTIVICRPSKLA